MKFAAFNARCPYELGDRITGTDGQGHTITDIVALHSMKTMTVRFVYELDGSGKLVALIPEQQDGRERESLYRLSALRIRDHRGLKAE